MLSARRKRPTRGHRYELLRASATSRVAGSLLKSPFGRGRADRKDRLLLPVYLERDRLGELVAAGLGHGVFCDKICHSLRSAEDLIVLEVLAYLGQNANHATLAYQREPPGNPWEAPNVLIVPPFSEYSVFYHRLTINRGGRLLLSYQYWSTHWFYRTEHWCNRRALLVSPDGGETWKLAGSGDL